MLFKMFNVMLKRSSPPIGAKGNIVKHLAMSVVKSTARSFVFTQDDTIATNICIIVLL